MVQPYLTDYGLPSSCYCHTRAWFKSLSFLVHMACKDVDIEVKNPYAVHYGPSVSLLCPSGCVLFPHHAPASSPQWWQTNKSNDVCLHPSRVIHLWQHPFHQPLWVRGRAGITCQPAFLTFWTLFIVSASEFKGYGFWFLLCCEAAVRLTALSWVVEWDSVIKWDLCLGVKGISPWRHMGWGTAPCITKFVTWRRVVSLTLHLL